ncbi:MAG: CDP-diacylglycerol--glycerol-3-phosphate 3-phosphatidyltransferase [Alphaproteobacteria bacterium]|nr:CDP-diacylglycerol--glycerol-3-phosphate 3-phosphatidyltransferase [Alphaproteobacteria bacterium]
MLSKPQIPNALTLARIVLILPILFVLHEPSLAKQWIFWLFIVAAATDFFDGYFARKWNVKSELGAMLDQISDKLLITAILIPLALYGVTGVLTLLVIVLREIYVSGLREHLGLQQRSLPVSRAGKYKTAVQMVAIGITLAGLTFSFPEFTVFDYYLGGSAQVVVLGNMVLVLGAILGVVSAIQYSLALYKKS